MRRSAQGRPPSARRARSRAALRDTALARRAIAREPNAEPAVRISRARRRLGPIRIMCPARLARSRSLVGLAATAVSGAPAAQSRRLRLGGDGDRRRMPGSWPRPSRRSGRPTPSREGDFATVIASARRRRRPRRPGRAGPFASSTHGSSPLPVSVPPHGNQARRARGGLTPRTWLGTETVARMLALRINHLQPDDDLELEVSEPATRAEAAYSIARFIERRLGRSRVRPRWPPTRSRYRH